jgi:hypothetical protein
MRNKSKTEDCVIVLIVACGFAYDVFESPWAGGLCREIIALPRRRVSCLRDTFQVGDCEPDGSTAPLLRSRAGRRHGYFDATDANARASSPVAIG